MADSVQKKYRIVFLRETIKYSTVIRHSKYGNPIVLPEHVRKNEIKLNISIINYIRQIKPPNKFYITVLHTKAT